MARHDLLTDMRETLGIVPGFVEGMSDLTLEHWWETAKGFWMTDTALPTKTKSLIGLGAAASQRCRY